MKVGWLVGRWLPSQPLKPRPRLGSESEGWLVGCFFGLAVAAAFSAEIRLLRANQPTSQPSSQTDCAAVDLMVVWPDQPLRHSQPSALALHRQLFDLSEPLRPPAHLPSAVSRLRTMTTSLITKPHPCGSAAVVEAYSFIRTPEYPAAAVLLEVRHG
jgi:hypothetical protein